MHLPHFRNNRKINILWKINEKSPHSGESPHSGDILGAYRRDCPSNNKR